MFETLDEATEASYRQDGWTNCHHRGGGIHINVKVHTDHTALWSLVGKLREELDATDDEVWRVLDIVSQRQLENWWEDLRNGNVDCLFSADIKDTNLFEKDYWSDGRHGGWLHVSENWVLNNPELMAPLANYCQESVNYFNSPDYVADLGMFVEEEYEENPDAGKERCPTCNKIK